MRNKRVRGGRKGWGLLKRGVGCKLEKEERKQARSCNKINQM